LTFQGRIAKIISVKDRVDGDHANRVETIASELAPRKLTPKVLRQIDMLRKRVVTLTKDDGPSTLQGVVYGFAEDMMNTRCGAIKDVPRAIAGAITHRLNVLLDLEPAQIRFMLSSALGMHADLEDKSRATSEKEALEGNPKFKTEYERWARIHEERAITIRALRTRLHEPVSTSTPAQRA